MGTKIKGIYKSFKFISQIFLVKERELEIGYPTDVKHVGHIGWDGPSGSEPSWMGEFKTGSDFMAASVGNSNSALSPWSSQDFGELAGRRESVDVTGEIAAAELAGSQKKQRRKKSKPASAPAAPSSSKSNRVAKLTAKFVETNLKCTKIEVA